jgi:hypothetical protein
VYYDAFVLSQKKDAICALRTGLAAISLSVAAGGAGKTAVSGSGHRYEEGTPIGPLRFKGGASQAAPAQGDDLSAWSLLAPEDGEAEVSATAGHKLVVAATDAAGRAVAASASVTVVVGA